MAIKALAASALLMMSASGRDPAEGCGSAAGLAGDRACADTPHGIVLAGSVERAKELAQIAATTESRFAVRFGRPVPRYAVVEGSDVTQNSPLFVNLERAGYTWRLPWLSPDAMTDAYKASITRAVLAQAKARDLGPEQTATLVNAALAQQADKWAPAAARAREAGTLPHELGHGWFIRAFWPSSQAKYSDHYGGPAPDWMDETAAVMMEDDALADQRRERFATLYRGSDTAAKARLLDLTAFLSGGHPALPKLDLPAGSSGVRVLTGPEAAGIAAAAGHFYLQARLFADYLVERSGDPAVFRSAADAFAGGHTTQQWLARSGPKYRLPTDISALDRGWREWVATRMSAGSGPDVSNKR